MPESLPIEGHPHLQELAAELAGAALVDLCGFGPDLVLDGIQSAAR